jgi:hypothetical protein
VQYLHPSRIPPDHTIFMKTSIPMLVLKTLSKPPPGHTTFLEASTTILLLGTLQGQKSFQPCATLVRHHHTGRSLVYFLSILQACPTILILLMMGLSYNTMVISHQNTCTLKEELKLLFVAPYCCSKLRELQTIT